MKNKIAVIGLGYVGLPLAVEFAKKFPTIGFDVNVSRVKELLNGYDRTKEVEDNDLNNLMSQDLISVEKSGKGLYCTSSLGDLDVANIFIVTVPTPTDANNRPILAPLMIASESIGKVLKKGDYVIYESTVYPGVTEDECVPVLENFSGLKFNEDFYVGYSPERINPGDKEKSVKDIIKVTSGSTTEAALFINKLYSEIISAGTFRASSIRVAEASKVIENTQRDINIAFVNELSNIFSRLGINTNEVLEAASTKWNFLPFKPGLVGGHCIGVDPYYLALKAESTGYFPELLLSARRINNEVPKFIAQSVFTQLISEKKDFTNLKALILGATFKENCPDTRNSLSFVLYDEFKKSNMLIDIYDPLALPDSVLREYGVHMLTTLDQEYDIIIIAVDHNYFRDIDYGEILRKNGLVFDVKGTYKGRFENYLSL